MSWLPGWNTVAGANTLENVFFWGSIIALILLGIMEVASHRAGQRKDELTEQQQIATQHQHDQDIAALHLQAAELKKQAATAEQRAAEANLELARMKAPRDLSPEQARAFTEALRLFAGTTFMVSTYPGDPETVSFADKIANAVAAAGWELIPVNSTPLGLVSGVFVTLNEVTGLTPDGTAIRDVNAAEQRAGDALLKALHDANIVAAPTPRESIIVNPKRVIVKITIGKKP